MKILFIALLMLTGVSTTSTQTTASNLGSSLSDSTSGKDRKDIARWFVVSLVQHPALGDLFTVSTSQIAQVDKTTAQIFTRLLTVNCNAEFKAAYKSGGSAAVESAFGTLGEVAAQEVVADPKVKKATQEFIKFIDLAKFGRSLTGP